MKKDEKIITVRIPHRKIHFKYNNEKILLFAYLILKLIKIN